MLPSVRVTNLIVFLGCTALILIALYLEHVMGMEPCPLCMTQRIAVIAVGVVALLAFLHNPAKRGVRVYAVLGLLLAVGGAYFSSRQLWLQSLPPDQVPACGPALEYMMQVFPFMDVLKAMLHGDGNCAEVDRLFGVSLALWTLLAFIGMAAVNLFQAVRVSRQA
ncbi:disulfide bond formation protein B [Cellvibrio polysaccharolyticus]|uniref:Disulfide bond formation protein B n=1 Tax=Cellvibrio polysaccharolyticus TaxID=2082724 RepID=A0A928V078_9GAMM|nr:disulfide bond formation protein B [Cellvibrio polysaccharolyticus]MBE8715912.1 disulfide bond formation protein B [Cellvibrio polysaccharolyticus]